MIKLRVKRRSDSRLGKFEKFFVLKHRVQHERLDIHSMFSRVFLNDFSLTVNCGDSCWQLAPNL